MRKFVFLLVFLAALAGRAAAFNYDLTVEDIPMYIIGTDITNAAFYSFYNIANVGLQVYLEDQSYLKFRLKDTYFALLSTNSLYIDRLSYTYYSDYFGALLGRDYYVEGDGILIGNLADGLRASLNLLGIKERFYVYYSGILPKEINQFDMTLSDLVLSNGPNRIFGGAVLEGKGFLGESISASVLYSADLSANKLYNPLYIGLDYKTTIIGDLAAEANAVLETGMLDSSTSIFAYAGNIAAYYLGGEDFKYGLIAKFSLASGDNNSGKGYSEFDTFGQYNTGIVIGPKFANLMIAQAGFLIKALNDKITLNGTYFYFMRMTTSDNVNYFYDGSGYTVGSEISGALIYDIDPNLTVFLTGGYFIKGNAFEDTTDKYKFIGGVSVKI